MKAVLVAAGRGERLEPLTLTIPKCLLPFVGGTLVEHHLRAIAEAKLKEVVIVVNHLEEKVRDFVGDGRRYGLDVSYARQERLDGTAHGLSAAKDLVGTENVVAIYADLLIGVGSVKHIVARFTKEDADAVLAVTRSSNPQHYGVVSLKHGQVQRIKEKPTHPVEKAYVNAGIYCFKPDIFDYIASTPPHPQRGEYELTTSLQMLIDAGRRVLSCEIDPQEWTDIGRPWDLLEANQLLLERAEAKLLGEVEDGAHLFGKVTVAEDARIRSGAYIEGPCIIASKADIGPNCYIRPATYIGKGVRIGNAVEIKNSIIMDHSHVGHLSYLGDSIIGPRCNLGAGTITANLRLDDASVKMMIRGHVSDSGRRKLGVVMGEEVKTGINVSLMPGVKIGPKAWVGAHLCVRRDIAAGEFLRT